MLTPEPSEMVVPVTALSVAIRLVPFWSRSLTMELINAETQQKVWLKLHQIKKVVDQAEYQW